MALAAYRELAGQWPKLRLVLVPRHPERFGEVAALLDQSGLAWERRSTMSHAASGTGMARRPFPTGAAEDRQARVLLVDSVGELGGWWGTADIAFVGGSLSRRGGQNMLEPAAYGAAVSFGPNTWNFRDIVGALLAADAAQVVNDGRELTEFVRRCLEEPSWAAGLGRRRSRWSDGSLGRPAEPSIFWSD